ncbi:SUN domain-containing protein 2 isoform X2 [Cyclopterus lumpus]|uniref:SUN domain-containing protein 2 isoform X2 n=1 Tax=Cyclopterus lumpus TaxID=8103 RepID=UPI001485CCA5|nr:SUN domain-containing protein 2 isoform X2 [Cyclopterus lumpus]
MSRRSSRLMSGGYYNSDDESDSSTVTNISYRENTVKVFKKKTGTRKKTSSRTPIGAVSDARSFAPAVQYEGLSPSPLSSPPMRTVPYGSFTATPRPPLTLQRPARPPPGPSETSPRPERKELSQSAVDSSGYSSSEGPRRTTPATSRAPSTGYWDRISWAFYSLLGSASQTATALKAQFALLTAPGVWLLLPSLTSLVSLVAESQPAASPPLPPPLHPVVDPAVEEMTRHLLVPTVDAAVEAKLRRVLEEQLKQQHLLSQVKEQLQLDLQDMKVQLAAADSGERLRLQLELRGQAEAHRSAAAGLGLRIQALEAQNAKLSQEWSSIQLMPPPAPCPETTRDHLTPELQQAMEKWLTDRIQEEAFRLADGGSCSACRRPEADKMADFALESQGASVVSTRCSETYRIRSACVTLFGFPLWYPTESPRTVIQGYPVPLPGKCWAFHGVQGTMVISLSHPITLTHVTLDHLPRYNSPTGSIDSAPKDFEVYGMKAEGDEGTLLGSFTYNKEGEPTQTFRLPSPGDDVHRYVELRVLSNWGQVEYTCLYRFRVHGEIAATP